MIQPVAKRKKPNRMTPVVTMTIPRPLVEWIAEQAKQRNVKKNYIVIEALEAAKAEEAA